ncbi:hypothetical protein PoB_000939400 [Plakobranchus ocellatus]|uniref:Uncharacterized protein n=1 Tax=Plakobranchus ocellatus TaxID=259542 RepID=A0AAV3YIQ6_9GAST|nr:hypothetical protein PoB_000939400 [Plakobranchus ocellatus]
MVSWYPPPPQRGSTGASCIIRGSSAPVPTCSRYRKQTCDPDNVGYAACARSNEPEVTATAAGFMCRSGVRWKAFGTEKTGR